MAMKEIIGATEHLTRSSQARPFTTQDRTQLQPQDTLVYSRQKRKHNAQFLVTKV